LNFFYFLFGQILTKKDDLSTQNSAFGLGEDEVDCQQTYYMPTDLDIWVDSVGRKKGGYLVLDLYQKP